MDACYRFANCQDFSLETLETAYDLITSTLERENTGGQDLFDTLYEVPSERLEARLEAEAALETLARAIEFGVTSPE